VGGQKPELLDEACRVVETGVPYIVDQKYAPDTDQWFKVSLHKLKNGLVATYVDITPIQKALLEAQQQSELIQRLLDCSINGVYAMEAIRDETGQIRDFRILMANPAAQKIAGLTREELVGKTYLSLFPSVQESGLLDRYVEAMESGTPFRSEMSFYTTDPRKEIWFDLSMSPTTAGLVILSFIDITDPVVLRKKQEKLLEQLRQSNRNLEQFAYVASHDLQEPARKIKSFGDLLLKQYTAVLPPAGSDLVQRMQLASTRMQDLIDGLLTYSRFSSQKEDYETIALNHLLSSVLTDLEAMIEEKKTFICIGQLPEVKGNQTQLRQLFQNLISNALKFTDEQVPRVRVESGPATPEEIREAVAGSGKKWLAIRVTDNGIGFDEAYRHRVFQLFVRLHGRSQYAGNGLGLAICKRVAELHGGGITVRSTPGVGTTFVVVLPEIRS
jgi:PAS domain S-box-containing protein